MKLSTTHHIKAPRPKVYAAITDAAVLHRCIDGCEKLVRTGEDAYDAHLRLGLAGIKGNYVGKLKLADKQLPESYTLVMEGKGTPGFVRSTARIRLVEKDQETELHCEADAQVGGPIAAIGSRLIEAAAKKMTDDFFKKFAQIVEGQT
jgi:carbon monoxide dehydrogenase subunit G